MARILLVLSGSDHWTLADGTRHPTGYWAEEFVAPHRTFVQKGLELEIATPGGVRPTVDEASLAEDDGEELRRYLESVDTELARPLDLAECARRADNYDAVYVPGGHGPMEDLPGNPDLGRILTELYDSGRIVAAMCHGPAGLLSAVRPDGGWVFAGRRMTAFTDEEENQTKAGKIGMPWYLETALKNRGVIFDDGDAAWVSHVVIDRNLITAQNEGSSEAAACAVLKLLAV